MINEPKIGRRASEDERAKARNWVDLYRLAERSPGGCHCLNPGDPNDEQSFIYADDPELLLLILSAFAEHGTFQAIDPVGIKRLIARAEFERLRKGGMNYEDSIDLLAQKYSCSTRTMERLVQVNDKP